MLGLSFGEFPAGAPSEAVRWTSRPVEPEDLRADYARRVAAWKAAR